LYLSRHVKYKLPKSGPVAGKVRRIAVSEIAQAGAELSRTASNGATIESIHKARRHLKKMRGLLRLARPALGRKRFQQENIFFRDVSREIRAARDAVALIESLDNLSRRSFDGPTPPVVKRLHRLLVLDARRLARSIKSEGTLARTSSHLAEKQAEVKKWKLDDFTAGDAQAAWRKARDASRRAFEIAHTRPTDDNLHEWRKKAKNLLYGSILLSKRSSTIEETMHATEKLTDLLGEDHDLSLLAKAIAGREAKLRAPDDLKVLQALIESRRKRLHTEAFALAKRTL
jgi:hypothetical protein